jgi:hypothetical protein
MVAKHGGNMTDPVAMQVRIPLDLRNWLRKAAEVNARSMNGQLVTILRNAKAADEKHVIGATA